MAHAIFNVSPVRFLSSFQDNVHTMTNSLKNKFNNSSNNSTNNNNDTISYNNNNTNNNLNYPVTLQLTLPEQQSDPIDIPRSIPLNIPNNGTSPINVHHSPLYDNQENLMNFATSFSRSPHEDLTLCFDGLAVQSPHTNSFYNNTHLNSPPQQIHSPIYIGSPQSPPYINTSTASNQLAQSPSFLNNLAQSPQSPSFLNVATHHRFGGSPQSPSFLNSSTHFESPRDTSFLGVVDHLGSPRSHTSFLNTTDLSQQFLDTTANPHLINSPSATTQIAGSPYNQSFTGSPSYNTSFAGSPNSPYFLGSPVIATHFLNDDSHLSPYPSASSQQVSPIQSPCGSYIGNTGLLFPPTPQFNNATSNNGAITTVAEATSPPPALSQSGIDNNTGSTTINEVLISPYLLPTQQEKEEKTGKQPRKSTVKKTTPSGRKAKIHKCPYCHHTSNRANNMKEHIQIHDPNRPKPHLCKLCHRPFARKHDMTRHYLSCKKHKLKSKDICK